VARFRSRALGLVLIAGALLVAFISRGLWLRFLGEALVRSDPPARADAALVLGGDYTGNRILKACEVARQGYVPRIFVSGPEGHYGFFESDLAIRFAVERGCPASWLVGLPNEAHSTREEAEVLLPELRRRGVRSLLIVTSDYHTRRARRIFEPQSAGVRLRFVAAPDRYFRARAWWRTRQGQKTVFFEWSKTLATAVGL